MMLSDVCLTSDDVCRVHRASDKSRKQRPRKTKIGTEVAFALMTLKVVSKSRVTWATFVPILVFLGLSILDLGPMYAKDR